MKKYLFLLFALMIGLTICGPAFSATMKAMPVDSGGVELGTSGNPMYISISGNLSLDNDLTAKTVWVTGTSGIRDNGGGDLEFTENNGTTWTDVGSGSGLWTDSGTYIEPGATVSTDDVYINQDLSVKGDLTIANTALYVDSAAGNVGIGDATPEAKLKVQGDAIISGDTTIQGRLYTSNGSGTGVFNNPNANGFYFDGGNVGIDDSLTVEGNFSYTPKYLSISGNLTLTAAQCTGGITVYCDGPAILGLPAIDDAMWIVLHTIGSVAVSIDCDPADKFWLDGTVLDDGDKVTNTSASGDSALIKYFSADGWYAQTTGFSDGGV